jgi:hypothetical protein
MVLVAFFLVFVVAIAADDLRRRWRRTRMLNPPPLARRLPAARLYQVLTVHVTVALGLTAAITAHVFGDVLPFLYLRHNLRRARKAQSRRFQAAK